jgi:hypothetical protein
MDPEQTHQQKSYHQGQRLGELVPDGSGKGHFQAEPGRKLVHCADGTH